MKKLISISSTFLSVAIFVSSCSSTKNINAPESLYKTEAGKEIALKSYDTAMDLWDVDYKEDYVKTDYGQSHVLVSGKKDGQPLILLPGLFADATMWYPNVGELSKHYRVFTLDMLNYGGKSQPSGKAIKDIYDYQTWFAQILNHYGLERVAVAGLSYGSWLALALAREMPETIASIMLLDPSETFMPMNGGIVWQGFKAFMFFPNREKYAEFFNWIGGGYTDPQLDVWFEHMLDVIEYGSTKMTGVPQHKIYEPEELLMVKMPVLVMAGGKPILYKNPEEFRTKALNAIPHAEVIIVPESGHGLNMEKPEYVNNKMVTFLEKNYHQD